MNKLCCECQKPYDVKAGEVDNGYCGPCWENYCKWMQTDEAEYDPELRADLNGEADLGESDDDQAEAS